jgi:hypothetical protein
MIDEEREGSRICTPTRHYGRLFVNLWFARHGVSIDHMMHDDLAQ